MPDVGPTQTRDQSGEQQSSESRLIEALAVEKGNAAPAESELAPCPTCGEPRGDETPCPHCGMD